MIRAGAVAATPRAIFSRMTHPRRRQPWDDARRRGAPPLVVVAEDDPVVAALASAAIEAEGWDVMVAADAMQAVMFTVRSAPAAVVLDIQMPAGSGVQVLQKLKANAKTADVPVVVLTGSTDPTLPDAVRALGAAAFLAKPLDPDALRDALRAAIAASSDGASA